MLLSRWLMDAMQNEGCPASRETLCPVPRHSNVLPAAARAYLQYRTHLLVGVSIMVHMFEVPRAS